MSGNVLGNLITLCVFAGLGAFISRWFKLPVRSLTWGLLALGALLGSFVGRGTSILSLFGFEVLLNWAIASCCVGTLIGLYARTSRTKKLVPGTR
jgi:uncharacterized membrane protein YjjB (DUF3815 family)